MAGLLQIDYSVFYTQSAGVESSHCCKMFNRLRKYKKNIFGWAPHRMLRNNFDIDWYYSFAFLTSNAIAGLFSFLPKAPI